MKHTNVLSLKYRPQRFSDVIGQQVACRILSKASSTNAVAPAYILSGTRGVGKTTLARIFAKALLCEHAPTVEPCNECSHCMRISKGQFVDVIELDAASHRSIDDIRDLRENVGFSPMEGRYKIFILDEAHMLTKEAYNALLKTLEEPPPFVVFIFASTDIQKFPATIISRCQQITLKSVPTSLLVEHLSSVLDKEGIGYTKDAIEVVARRGFGSVRDSLSLLGQVLVGVQGRITREAVEEMLGLATHDIYLSIIDAMIAGDTLRIIDISHSMLEKGIDIKYFLQELTALCRTLCLVKQHKEKAFYALDIPNDYQETLLQCVEKLSLQQIHMCWQMVLYGQKQVLESIEPSVALELLLLNMVSLRSIVSSTTYVEHTQSHAIISTPHTQKTSRNENINQAQIQGISESIPQQKPVQSVQAGYTQALHKEEVKQNIPSPHAVQKKSQQADAKPQPISIREKMSQALRESSYAIEGNPIEEVIASSPPKEEQQASVPAEGSLYKNKVTKEYSERDEFPILDIIEEEFETTYRYVHRNIKE